MPENSEFNFIDIDNQDELYKSIQQLIVNGFDTSDIDNGKDSVYTKGNYTYTITSTENQKNNNNKSSTSIDLGNCENKLKVEYNIPENFSLYILKIDALLEDLRVPKIEYEIYFPFSSNNMTKLDLSLCQNIKIDIRIPVDIDINDLYKYNQSSDIYNDVCYKAISESGNADIPLDDRKQEYMDNKMSLCEEDCILKDYDNITKNAICSCYTKIDVSLMSEIKVDKKKLFSNFKK